MKMMMMPIWVVTFAVAFTIAFVLVLHRRRHRRAARPAHAIVVLIVLIVLILVGLIAGLYVVGRPVRVRQIGSDTTAPAAVGTPWIPAEHDGFIAEVYPSEPAAAEALARRLGSAWLAGPDRPETISRVTVVGSAGVESLHRAADGLRSLDAIDNVAMAGEVATTGAEESGAQTARVRIDLADDGVSPVAVTTSGGQPGPQRSGTLRGLLDGAGVETSRTVAFVEKPWVADLAGFIARNPGRHWLVAAADRASTSQDEATRRAVEVASAMLESRVREALGRHDPGLSQRAANSRWLRSRIQAQLESNPRYVADRFAQRFDRPYGAVWQQWLLVDGSQAKVTVLARNIAGGARQGRGLWVRRIFSIAALAAVIFVVYLFLNAATRGYYVWALRVAGVVLGVGAIVLLLMLA